MTKAVQLTRSDLDQPGLGRRRSGRGFRYLSPSGEPVKDPDTVRRIKDLVIPPAWRDVWICPDERGHIQATGTDDAGRRQYRYHDLWRVERDGIKFDHVAEFGAALPGIRETISARLAGRGLTRDRVLAAGLRLVDLGFFRAGGEEYEARNGSFGLATVRREHVTCGRGELVFEYTGKGAVHREQAVADDEVCAVVRGLKRRRWGGDELLAYRTSSGGHDVTAADLNEYLREISGADFTVKDFRTWHATVLAAVGLAVSRRAETEAARKRAVARVVREVADYLGNTPAVARSAYIDPRVIESYEQGRTIARVLGELGADTEFGELATNGQGEAAVLRLLRGSGAAGS